MNYIVGTYIAYLAVSSALTIWVAGTLYRRGNVFLVDALHGNEELAQSVNHLLVVGFYLINFGYIALALRTAVEVEDMRGAIELLSDKVGVVLLVVGAMHFFNLLIFSKIRRRAQDTFAAPPVPPDMRVAPPAL